jgi:hypothetical protein
MSNPISLEPEIRILEDGRKAYFYTAQQREALRDAKDSKKDPEYLSHTQNGLAQAIDLGTVISRGSAKFIVKPTAQQ